MKFTSIFIALLTLVMTGCSVTHKQGKLPSDSEHIKYVYIIQNPYQRNNLDKTILEEIQKLGIPAKIGYPSETEKDNSLMVNYFDSWSWDLVPYLRSLEIQIFDPSNDTIISRARFENHLVFHSYPSETEKTAYLINQLFQNNM